VSEGVSVLAAAASFRRVPDSSVVLLDGVSRETLSEARVRVDLEDAFFFAPPPDSELSRSVACRRAEPFAVDLLARFAGASNVAAMSSEPRCVLSSWSGNDLSVPLPSSESTFFSEGSCDSGKKTSVGRADGVSVCVSGMSA
jgi:hypothetical protein